MKGMVFTEFLEMVESRFSIDMVDSIVEDAAPASGGAYTAVGTYPHTELVDMVVALSKRTSIPVSTLVSGFGEYLFSVFAQKYTRFFPEGTDTLTFLSGIESIIHVEVLKLYPDAQLPTFECRRMGDELEMVYRSQRHFADLAEGLIRGCANHFQERIQLERRVIDEDSTLFIVRLCF